MSCKADVMHGPWTPPLLIISKTSAHCLNAFCHLQKMNEATVQFFLHSGYSFITSNNGELTSLTSEDTCRDPSHDDNEQEDTNK